MGGRNDYFGSEDPVHPGAPDGGTGRGHSRSVEDSRGYREASAPHPSSPAARTWDWLSFDEFDLFERLELVREALDIAKDKVPGVVWEETGEELGEILKAIIPSIVLSMCVIVSTTILGGAIGAAVGAFALGWGAIPTGIFGAQCGAEAGVLLLQGLGLTVIGSVIGVHLVRSLDLATDGVSEAWHAADSPQGRRTHVQHAGATIAKAVGVFMRAVLQGVVAVLLTSGARAAASRVPMLVAELRRFNPEFAAWIERNWARLIENPKLREERPKLQDGEGGPKPSEPPPKQDSTSKPQGDQNREQPNEPPPPPPPKQDEPPPPPPKRERIPGSTDEEHRIDEYLQDKGHKVEPNPQEGQAGAGRQGDRYVDGRKTEYKTVTGVKKTDENSLSGAISSRSMDARGQASDVIVDTRGQQGMTQSAAQRGINRAYAADNKAAGGPKLQNIRVIGDGFDISVPRQ